MVAAVLLSLCLSGSVNAEAASQKSKTINLTVGHHFSKSDAHARVQLLLDYWKRRYSVDQVWDGDKVLVTGTVIGVPFHALIEVNDASVRCESSDPGVLLRGRASDYVQRKLQKYLHPQYLEP